jgi:hypothetical protein
MNKIKRILALIGALLLAALYISTLVFALSGSDNYMNLLMASIYATIVIPVLLWAYTLIYRLLRKNDDESADGDVDNNSDDNDSGNNAYRR